MTTEFRKRLDPDLPFYYYTSAHTWFYEDVMPDFSIQALKPRKVKRAPQRELLGASHHVTLATHGSVVVELPPPPKSSNRLVSEHSCA